MPLLTLSIKALPKSSRIPCSKDEVLLYTHPELSIVYVSSTLPRCVVD